MRGDDEKPGVLPDDRLDSWKEIAAYLGRGVRTVQRWEQDEGLPVHRLAHEKRGTIYARKSELAAWWDSRRLTLPPPASDEPDETPAVPRLERVTRTSGTIGWPALSSDARLVAYVSDGGQDGTTPQIWIQQVGGAALRLTNGERRYSCLSFAHGDTRIVFTADDGAGEQVYEMPTLGGDARLLARSASSARFSPDGQWLASLPVGAPGIRLSARGGAGFRTVAADLINISCLTWLPHGDSVLVHARTDPAREADWWAVPVDGRTPLNTGIIRRFRELGLFTIPLGAEPVGDSVVVSAAGPQGISLYRQRIVLSTWQLVGTPQRLTEGHASAWLPCVAAGRLAFVSSQTDANLWSMGIDAATGLPRGPLRRLTRGPGIVGYLSATRDARTLAYFSVRLGNGDIFLRDLHTGVETVLVDAPPGARSYPAISPSGRQLAYGLWVQGGERALRPIWITDLVGSTFRTLGEDCGGRPRQWVDERVLIIERFARLNSIAVIDTDTGAQRELLESAEQSLRNPSLSPDGRWIAFDAERPGEGSDVVVAPFRDSRIRESEWVVVDRAASHPFWSADGRLLYYLMTGANPMLRSLVHARAFTAATGRPEGEPIRVYNSLELLMPAYLPGAAPIATPDQIVFILGDFRGDVWMMDL